MDLKDPLLLPHDLGSQSRGPWTSEEVGFDTPPEDLLYPVRGRVVPGLWTVHQVVGGPGQGSPNHPVTNQ